MPSDRTTEAELGQWYDDKLAHHEALSRHIEETVAALLKPLGFPIASLKSSVKSRERFLEKATDGTYRDPIAEIHDVSRARVVTYLLAHRDRIVEVLGHAFAVTKAVTAETRLEHDRAGYRGVNLTLKFTGERAEDAPFRHDAFEIQVHTALENTWAEIDHRRYELRGIVPRALQRRFNVVSMTLELADAEFNRVVEELEKYERALDEKVELGEVSTVELSSTTLGRFLQTHLKAWPSKKPRMNDPEIMTLLMDELRGFGIATLDDVRNLLSPAMLDRLRDKFSTVAGLLRTAMLVERMEHYFEAAWQNHWYDCFGHMYEAIVLKYGRSAVDPLLRAKNIKFPGSPR